MSFHKIGTITGPRIRIVPSSRADPISCVSPNLVIHRLGTSSEVAVKSRVLTWTSILLLACCPLYCKIAFFFHHGGLMGIANYYNINTTLSRKIPNTTTSGVHSRL